MANTRAQKQSGLRNLEMSTMVVMCFNIAFVAPIFYAIEGLNMQTAVLYAEISSSIVIAIAFIVVVNDPLTRINVLGLGSFYESTFIHKGLHVLKQVFTRSNYIVPMLYAVCWIVTKIVVGMS
jgi:hypothetical protein